MAAGLVEHTIMTNLRREYEAQGYEFYENPPREAVPAFLGGYQPDAIAVRGDQGVVLEIKANTGKPAGLDHIAERFVGQTRWQFRIFLYDAPEEAPRTSTVIENLEALLRRVDRLKNQNEPDGALLLGWAVLEAVVRAKSKPMTSRVVRTSQQIAERLEHLGVISSDQADLLRRSATIRNAVAHGRFDVRPGTGLIDITIDVARALYARKGQLPEQ